MQADIFWPMALRRPRKQKASTDTVLSPISNFIFQITYRRAMKTFGFILALDSHDRGWVEFLEMANNSVGAANRGLWRKQAWDFRLPRLVLFFERTIPTAPGTTHFAAEF